MAKSENSYTCLPCHDEDGKPAVPATHRLLVREVGEQVGHEVWGCSVHIAQLYRHFLRTKKPLDVIVHAMETGARIIEAHPRQMG